MRHRRIFRYALITAVLAPGFPSAATPTLNQAQSALLTAQHEAAAHKTAAALARQKSRADTIQAALLAERQIAAAAALRRLENQTGSDAATLAALQAQSNAASDLLQQNETALAKLLPIMQRLASQPAAIMLAVPESPDDAIRGIIVMQALAGEIAQRAAAVRQQSNAVISLLSRRAAQQTALTQAVAIQQKAEDALSAQIAQAKAAETADAAASLTENAAAILANRKINSLRDMIGQLQANAAPPPSHINILPGEGDAPVSGFVIQRFGDDTVAGPAVGVSYRAAPGARVVTPCAGPVLFANKFQTYGMVVIVDCGGGYDFVLSGMQHLDVSSGQRLSHGQPVGEMLGYNAHSPARQPVLYVELRQNGTPVDPAAWLNEGGSG